MKEDVKEEVFAGGAVTAGETPLQNGLGHRSWTIVTAMIIFGAIFVRLLCNFRHELAPGMDAAYYPMQTRWLIENGELQLSAMPLIFWIDAVVAHVMMSCGVPLEIAVARACRLVDCFLQPWSAVPVMALGYGWSLGKRAQRPVLWICSAAALLVVMSPPTMRMASDLQKNSLGIVWMAFCIWSMRETLSEPKRPWRWATLAVFVLLSGLTHIGAFGVTIVILAGCLLGYATIGGELFPAKVNRRYMTFVLLGIAGVALVLWFAVPTQFGRIGTLVRRVLGMGFSPSSIALSVVVYSVLAVVLRWLFFERKRLSRADLSIAIGVCCGLAIATAPFLGGVWSMRFLIMTPVPASVLLMLVCLRLTQVGDAPELGRLGKTFVALSFISALVAPFSAQGPVVSTAAIDEIRQLRTQIDNPSQTMVVAPHGLEFWAGHLLRTHVKMGSLPDDLTQYERILLLQPSEASMMKRHPAGMPHHRDKRWRNADSRLNGNGVEERTSVGHQGGPPSHRLTIPSNVEIVSENEYFTLYELQ